MEILKGTGKPEVLKNESAYSRRIDEKNRLVYRIVDGFIWIIACKWSLWGIGIYYGNKNKRNRSRRL